MPENDDSIVFSSEFDAADFAKGVDGMIGGLKAMQVEEKKLQESIAESQKRLEEQTEQVKLMDAALGKAGKNTKDYTEENKRMASGMAILVKQNQALNDAIGKQKEQLTSASTAVKDMQTKYEAAAAAIKKANEATGKTMPFDSTKIVQDITKVKDAVIANGKAAVSGVAQSVAQGGNVVESVTSSIEGMGAAFGPLAAAGSAALGLIITKLYELATAESEAEVKQRLVSKAISDAGGEYVKAAASVFELNSEVTLAKEGSIDKDKVVEHYNTTIGKTIGLAKDLDEVESLLAKNAENYIKFTLYKAAANLSLEEAAKKAFEAEKIRLKKESEFKNIAVDTRIGSFGSTSFNAADYAADKQRVIDAQKKRQNEQIKVQEDGKNKSLKIAEDFFKKAKEIGAGFNFFGDTKATPPGKGGKAKIKSAAEEIQNIYDQELQKLSADIARISEKTFTDEGTITKAVAEDFKKRSLAFDKAFAKGQLTGDQLKSLKDNLGNLQKLVTEKDVKAFRDQRAEYLQKIGDELENMENDQALKRIALIQDNFERERQLIEAETDKTISAIEQKRDKKITDLKKGKNKNGIAQALFDIQIAEFYYTADESIALAKKLEKQRLNKLSFDTFQKVGKENSDRNLNTKNLGISEGSLIDIKKQSELYMAGKISYAEYQKELTRIARAESQNRFEVEKNSLEQQIVAKKLMLSLAGDLTKDQRQKLQDEITALQKQLADAEKANITNQASNKKSDFDKSISQYVQYAQAISSIINTIGQAWQQENEREAKAIDRSISMQQRRVDAAQKIADRGNATYLKMEQDRLNQLEVKREANARRQIAINAALQASQTLTALISAIAQGATVGGPLGAIISLGGIIAAISSGYSIVKSLQQPPPTFFVGTEDTGKGGKVDNKGGFHAILHPNERVLTAEQNKKLNGISNKDLVEKVTGPSPDAISNLMARYAGPRVPGLNYDRLEAAASSHITHDGKLVAIMQDFNEKQDAQLDETRRLNKNIRNIQNSVKIDRNGIAVSLMEAIDQFKINQKA